MLCQSLNREDRLLLFRPDSAHYFNGTCFPTRVDDNPLEQYLDSLNRLLQLNPADCPLMENLDDLDARIDQLYKHHGAIGAYVPYGEWTRIVRAIVNELFGSGLDVFNLFPLLKSLHLLMMASQGQVQTTGTETTNCISAGLSMHRGTVSVSWPLD